LESLATKTSGSGCRDGGRCQWSNSLDVGFLIGLDLDLVLENEVHLLALDSIQLLQLCRQITTLLRLLVNLSLTIFLTTTAVISSLSCILNGEGQLLELLTTVFGGKKPLLDCKLHPGIRFSRLLQHLLSPLFFIFFILLTSR